MRPLQKYIEQADELVDEVLKPYGAIHSDGSAEFHTLVIKARMYRATSRAAENHQLHNMLTEQEKADLLASRHEFAEAYKAFWEKTPPPKLAP